MKITSLQFLTLFILLGGFIVRLYGFSNPIADWHSHRQSDTSAVSKNFVEKGFDILHPRYFDISNIQSGLDNPEGYRFVEFPIYNIFQAGLFTMFKILTLEEWGRLISIISSLVSGYIIYLFVSKYVSKRAGLFSLFFYCFLPFSIYYGRTILPDQMMVSAILLGIYFFDKWTCESSKFKVQSSKPQLKSPMYYVISIIFTMTSFLLKPYALFFTLPMIYLAYNRFGFTLIKKWQLWLFLFLTILPLLLWRIWIQNYPEGIPQFAWLFNSDGIRFKGAFFYHLFAERISRLILGYFGITLLFLGLLIQKGEKRYLLFTMFLVSSLIYMSVIATGNVRHDYYQILIIPTISILVGRGADFLLNMKNEQNKIGLLLLLAVIIVGTFAFSWFYIRGYYVVNQASIEAGNAAKRILPKDARVIAPLDGDTTLLNQIERKGWPAFEKSDEDLVRMRASYMILLNPTENDFSGFGRKYQIVKSSNTYLILKLQ